MNSEKTAAMLEEIQQVRAQDEKVKHRIQGHAIIVTHGLKEGDVCYATECIGCGERKNEWDKAASLWRWKEAAGSCTKLWIIESKIDEIKSKHMNTDDGGNQVTLKSLHEELLKNQRKLDQIIKHFKIK
jgi:hypothetical protein